MRAPSAASRAASLALAGVMCALLLAAPARGEVLAVDGRLAPGASPGCNEHSGNLIFGASATLEIEIAGEVPCTGHDRVSAAGAITLLGGTFELVLLDGYVPAPGSSFTVLAWGSLSGTFASFDVSAAPLPAPLDWDFSTLYTNGEIRVTEAGTVRVPLPIWSSLALAGGLLVLGGRRSRAARPGPRPVSGCRANPGG